MSAFACITCGEPVTARNPLAQKLMEVGGKMPMCRNCRNPKGLDKTWPSYEAYLASPEWKALVARRRKLDGNKCRLCYGTERLEVHHRTYDRKYHEDIEDLTTLCHECHSWYSAWVKAKESGRELVGFKPVGFSMD